ncbi:DUF4097 family beta strand repeat-containing protein [Clostridium aminobutyricum]|uniref:DUF4097 family beta strand repeat protein n=1 Tax=Clostridium aminobutyricum TaxID=33953 RepID=A0A939DAR7_CLOAM|nr:DUF4097 family beta strand repeat-containing protein [Clostridium aminobutyricum]MBN7774285.1 DUF4097 family beta strand repeat protein [Clostridium aminobutyricum]
MSKRLKVFIITCICLIIAGTCLAGLGLMLGADGNINLKHMSWNLNDDKSSFNLSLRKPESQAGFSGKTETETIKFNQPILSIETKVGIGEVYLVEGDEFKIEYTYDKGFGKPNINFSDGSLSIVDKFGKGGVDFSVKKWSSFKGSEDLEYRIYYPKGTNLEFITMNNNLGDIDISNIKTKSLKIKLDVGDVNLEKVNIETAELDSSLGNIKTKDTETNGLTASTKMGDMHIEGILKGVSSLSAEMGDIKLISTLGKDQYSLHFDMQLGDIKVDGEQRGGSYSASNSTGDSGENRIEARTSAGDIKAIFE